jgi:hypothetical protein
MKWYVQVSRLYRSIMVLKEDGTLLFDIHEDQAEPDILDWELVDIQAYVKENYSDVLIDMGVS